MVAQKLVVIFDVFGRGGELKSLYSTTLSLRARNHISKHHIYHLIDSPKPLQRLTKADQLAFLSASLKKKKNKKQKPEPRESEFLRGTQPTTASPLLECEQRVFNMFNMCLQ